MLDVHLCSLDKSLESEFCQEIDPWFYCPRSKLYRHCIQTLSAFRAEVQASAKQLELSLSRQQICLLPQLRTYFQFPVRFYWKIFVLLYRSELPQVLEIVSMRSLQANRRRTWSNKNCKWLEILIGGTKPSSWWFWNHERVGPRSVVIAWVILLSSGIATRRWYLLSVRSQFLTAPQTEGILSSELCVKTRLHRQRCKRLRLNNVILKLFWISNGIQSTASAWASTWFASLTAASAAKRFSDLTTTISWNFCAVYLVLALLAWSSAGSCSDRAGTCWINDAICHFLIRKLVAS